MFRKKDKQLEYNLIVTGLHLLDNHGKTINEIKKDGFKISHKLKMFYNSYKGDGASMVESMGNILNEIPKVLTNIKKECLLHY